MAHWAKQQASGVSNNETASKFPINCATHARKGVIANAVQSSKEHSVMDWIGLEKALMTKILQ